MKKAALAISILCLAVGCSSEPTESNLQVDQTFDELVQDFASKNQSDVIAIGESIKACMQKVRFDAIRPLPESRPTLNFDKGEVILAKFNMWPDSTVLGSQNQYFSNERDLNDAIEAIENPVSFNPSVNENARKKLFLGIQEKVEKWTKNAKYLVVLKDDKKQLPKWFGDQYDKGTYDGRILIYDLNANLLIGGAEFYAESSSSASASIYGDLGKSLMKDFNKNIEEAFDKVLREEFNSKGSVSWLVPLKQ